MVGPDYEINCSNALNFMTSTDAIARKERICFDHELVRDQNKLDNYTATVRIVIQLVFSCIASLKACCYMITILLE